MSGPTTPSSPEQLQQELKQREYEIALLRETAMAVSSELDLELVLKLIAERARELIQSDTLLIPILDEACDVYTYRAGAGANAEEIVGESLPLEFGVCGWVWRHKKAWWRGVLSELTEDERNRWEKEAGTLILVPLVGRKHFLGGLVGINKRTGGDFTERDLQLLELFAGHAAIAIENAMAMQAVEEARQAAENYQHELKQLNRRLSVANQELEYLSLYDQLTELPNRSLFCDRLQQQIDQADKGNDSFALLIIDLDRFQDINDAFGHEVGDELLKITAHRFANMLNPSQTLSRMAGDQYAILAPGLNATTAMQLADDLRTSLTIPIRLGKHEILASATIGIALCPQHGNDVSDLLKHGDAAMYSAKREKHGVHLYDAKLDQQTSGRLALLRDLQQALDNREFRLHYQPKLALASGDIIGVEALARWPHKERGPVPTDMFISALEQTGLIAPFSYWVIETAFAQRALWLTKGWDLKIAVNIPITLILEPHFIGELEKIAHRFPGTGGLIFEITESIFFSDYDRLNAVLREIQQRFGINFSIDDFGTGHSSLSRLRKLPVTELKIDRSFVMDMLHSKDDAAIVRSTIELAHNLGLQVVAEGVENEKVMAKLYQLRCDIVQGYYISKALPVAEIEEFFRNPKRGQPPPAAPLSLERSDKP